jgi:hypothetical protein
VWQFVMEGGVTQFFAVFIVLQRTHFSGTPARAMLGCCCGT